VVENRGGAGGSIGTEAAARATPDGYTMVLASTSEIAINPSLYKLTYDTTKDLAPAGLVATSPMVVIVTPSLPVNTMAELVAHARANPGQLNVASAGNGTITHLSGELFRSMHGLSWTHVPYKGTGPALTDLGGGQVQAMFVPPPPALALVKANRARLLAVSGRTRLPSLADVPTVAESVKPEYVVDNWSGLFVPAGTPQDIVDRLAGELAQVLRSPEFAGALAPQGLLPGTMARAEFAGFVRDEARKWGDVVRAAGVKVE
jgi:tripartite-type tricarboxylate transporter receptor subunit TctC